LIQELMTNRENSLQISISEPVVVFLVVNRIRDLPNLSIQSALANTTSNVVIGYFSEEDIAEIQPHARLFRIKLDNDENFLRNSKLAYSDFGKLEFFYLVTFKWVLLQELFSLGFEVLIYSDLDVAWFKDAVTEMAHIFHNSPNINIAIQSATLTPTQPRLCMGFAAFRKSEQVDRLISVCHLEHLNAVKAGHLIGDDDVVTNYYLSDPGPKWILELPQVAFPVGVLMNAYLRDRTIPGLNLPLPFIFHANYVVGERNKRLLMRYAIQKIDSSPKNRTFNWEMRILLIFKRLRFIASVIKKSFNQRRSKIEL